MKIKTALSVFANKLFIYTVPSKSIETVETKLLCWMWSQDIYKYDYINEWDEL